MIKPFTRRHISKILEQYNQQLNSSQNKTPLDSYLRNYLKENKSIGANDRRQISENVFQIMRHKIYLDAISPKPLTWNGRLDTLHSQKFSKQLENNDILKQVRCSCPQDLWKILEKNYGEEKAFEYCNSMNERAPLTIRVNPLKITRDELLNRWKNIQNFGVKATEFSPLGIQFTGQNNKNLYELPEFKRGYFEIQDEASQLAGLRIQPGEKDKIFDYCAGSGGKSLTFGPAMRGKGLIYLYDVRPQILREARKRMSRAGIYNITFVEDLKEVELLKGKMDWLVLDVPCTGTGTLRRNPDLKYKFTNKMLEYYMNLQKGIVENSIKYIKKDGKIVYSTCSLLPEENIKQIAYFCEKYGLQVENDKHFQILPDQNHKMDSFFSATLIYK